MVKGFSKKLIDMIIIISLLLALCVAVDYATSSEVNNIDSSMLEIQDKSIIVVNDSSDLYSNGTAIMVLNSSGGKVHIDKSEKSEKSKKLPTISMWAKPSVRSGYSYRWYKFTWIDYCPNCHHYNCLLKNPKGVPEMEYTCKHCDSDFCAVTGKEKYSWSRVYLTRA